MKIRTISHKERALKLCCRSKVLRIYMAIEAYRKNGERKNEE